MENSGTKNQIRELEEQLRQKLVERGNEISEHGQHDNAVVDSIDMEISILKERIMRLKSQKI